MIDLIRRYLYFVTLINGISLFHLMLYTKIWPTTLIGSIIALIFVIINLMILMQIFIRTTRIMTKKKQFSAFKNKVIYGFLLMMGVLINGCIMYLLLIVSFQLFAQPF